ncbi:MAG: isoprenoid biosynthesis glyoxalase ElbB [Magnetococcales bacterium]|nr:isoprenoid biosynthesis glyoxalase ElbB [Magnetococcales bacterium]
MKQKRIGVVLSGCGVYDGAEIHEAVLTLFFLARSGAEAVVMAPDMTQHHVINHLTGEVMAESRNVLIESARIARGKIRDLARVGVDDLDGIILPGGFGAAKNLSSIAFDGPKARVDDSLAKLLRGMHAAGKPIGALCISPALLARVFHDRGITLTIGSDADTAGAIRAMGNAHQESGVEEIVVDAGNRVITSPAYMCAAGIAEVGLGIEKLVSRLLSLVGS